MGRKYDEEYRYLDIEETEFTFMSGLGASR
jgi:hypothetical protein